MGAARKELGRGGAPADSEADDSPTPRPKNSRATSSFTSIHEAKVRAPAAAMALIERVDGRGNPSSLFPFRTS